MLLTVSVNAAVYSQIPVGSTGKTEALLNEPIDISGDFRNFSNTYYLADSLSSFDPKTGSGRISYKRYEYFTRQAFDNMLAVLKPVNPNEFPTGEYAASPTLPFSIEFISARTLRIRTSSRFQVKPDEESLMLAKYSRTIVHGNTVKLNTGIVITVHMDRC
jgi:alpha-D-xyloside xylohydrolase